MIKKQSRTYRKFERLATVVVGAFVLASCAEDGFDEESFVSGGGVTNTKLTTPSADSITVEASTDGSKQIISWPLVYGAGSYHAVLTNTDNGEVLADTVIDGIEFAASREDETNYSVSLQVLGNTSLNNSNGEEVTKTYNTFAPSYTTIPSGADLNTYFAENPIPDDSLGKEMIFDLEGGGNYTVSDFLDFGDQTVTLRSTQKNNKPTVTYTAASSTIGSNGGLVLKYLAIDAAGTENGLMRTSATISDSLTAGKLGNYYDLENIYAINTCDVTNLRGYIYDDNSQSYLTRYFTIYNSVIQTATEKMGSASSAPTLINCKGFIEYLTINMSTIYNTSSTNASYFVRYQGRPKDITSYDATAVQSITITNSTLYNLAKGTNFANYRQSGQATNVFVVTDLIEVDCGKKGQFVRRLVGGQANASDSRTFSNNTYWYEGAASDESGYDKTGTILTTDPGFADAANGDFTVSGADQIANQTGDPRWLK